MTAAANILVFTWTESSLDVLFECVKEYPRKRSEVSNILTHICLMDLFILINWTSPFRILGVLVYFFQFYSILIIDILLANSDPDQMQRSTASDRGLHCLPMSQKSDTRLVWVKYRES